MSEFYVLDVGHGNAAVLREGDGAVVFDTPRGDTLLRALGDLDVTQVDYVFISHGDTDHAGGAAALLSSQHLRFQFIVVNPDATKTGRGRRLLAAALNDALNSGRFQPLAAFTGTPSPIAWHDRKIEVLGPSYASFLSGPGGKDLLGASITSNGSSIVLRISRGDFRVLLPGDMDEAELEDLRANSVDLRADVLVFPHHGGALSEQEAVEYARRVTMEVRPTTVVFSIGRVPHAHPHPGAITGLRQVVPDTHVMCTQLSRHCAAALPAEDTEHLLPLTARGKAKGCCCAGTVRLIESEIVKAQPYEAHQKFIDRSVPTPMCRHEP